MSSGHTNCKVQGCTNKAVIGAPGQGVCLDHFFAKCYEQLDHLELRVRNRLLDGTEAKAARAFLEECSSRALFICFRNEFLTNLERSRLLEILLSCGDLQLLLCRASLGLSGSETHASATLFSKDARQEKRESQDEGFTAES